MNSLCKMSIICCICRLNLIQSHDIVHTQCGHVFHLDCLTQWLERKKTCPQCREKVSQNRVHKLYFTISSNEAFEPSDCSQERIDSMKFQLLLKDKNIKYYNVKCVTLQRQGAGLRKEVRRVESEINQKNSAIHALKEQVKYFKEQSLKYDNLKIENSKLQAIINNLKPLQTLLNAPVHEVTEMVGEVRDPEVLMSYVNVLKSELCTTVNKYKDLRMGSKRLQEDYAKLNTKYDSLLKGHPKTMDLEEKLAISESNSMSLQRRVKELEKLLCIEESSSSNSEAQNLKKKSNNSKTREETSHKTRAATKRKQKTSESPTKDMDNSDIAIVNCSSSSDSSLIPKRSRVSDDNNVLKNCDSSMCTNYTIPKRKCLRKKMVPAENKRDTQIVDLT